MAEPVRQPKPEDQSDGHEFDRFRELAAKLVSVPKSAIDAARRRDKSAG